MSRTRADRDATAIPRASALIADPGNIPALQIRWPSGITHTVSSVPAEAINGLLQIHEPPSADQPPRLVVLH